MKDVDFVITTMHRPKCVKKLLKSIYKYYPGIDSHIYVADQSEYFNPSEYRVGKEYIIQLPFDCGLSYARNYLFDYTPSKYKLLLDDDFVFNKNTKIEKFVDIIQHTGADIVGGGVVNPSGRKLKFEYKFTFEDGTLYQESLPNKYKKYNGIKYRESDVVLNFGLFKKDVQRWDPKLKVCEHTDYYTRYLNKNRKIIHVPEVTIDHDKVRSTGYRKLRSRNEYIKLFMQKNGISKIIRDGELQYKLEGNSMTRIYRKRDKATLRIKKK